MKKTRLTLKDVANQLGVSTATISNAFNRPDQLSKKKRIEILEQCKRIGFEGPNKAAQILRKGHSNIIGIVLSDNIDYIISDPVASTFMKGATEVLREHKKHTLLYSGDSENIGDIADFVDGFICYGAPINQALVSELANQLKPVVTVDFDIENIPSINVDNETACFEIAKSTLKESDQVAILGLRLIDSKSTCRIYDSPLLDFEHSISHRRLDGYIAAAKTVGISIEGDRIWTIAKNTSKYASQAANEALTSIPRPDVILCMSDLIALEVLKLAKDKGIKVPEELRITGFDGIDEALRTRPSLTTICQANAEKGKAAAETLLLGLTTSRLVSYEMKIGEST
ncbi:LacI family DNA-binding transcriptional regulator [Psychrosphaera sp. B3R10]|uniref:LacI family DNA-binding transcriptional regulator n=1 Tax=unclassified Psychrosphaera TaxID=2641570 RepID=UPI001C096550|nr:MULTISPECIES: LacI family DNA-binding transcriptional regulator [unclassified Psychrosphaera]MBU2882729.1 LacI family DNA-binding transcriptional regulator [Psychrosphaera sp. I2R16]MBU2989253.1 LacI family DNA-binding transcriptional regulator [Psychrosphaera sp. B3R10]MDO6721389.1 LacI family DNA-binding transcriptional regulator [Psychrosphaera sp. 1_MG-2023]